MLPPQYRIDGPMVVILENDDAWDADRIAKEKEELKDGEKHPVDEYLLGQTRYDLEHSKAKEYLLPNVAPTKFVIRRLKVVEEERIKPYYGTNNHTAIRMAFQYGLVSVDDPSGSVTLTDADRMLGMITLDWIDDVFVKAIGSNAMVDVGTAVIIACGDLTASEKKA